MGKINSSEVHRKVRSINRRRLYQTFQNKSFAEVEELMGRVLTPSEIEMVSKRIAIAVLLEVGADYRQIQQLIKVSKATIAKVNNLYRYDEPFRKLIQKFVKEEYSSKSSFTLTGAAKGLGEALRIVSQIH